MVSVIEHQGKFAVRCTEHGEPFNDFIVRAGEHISNTMLLIFSDRDYTERQMIRHNKLFHGN